jgi:phosphoglycolate phosphatase
VGIAERFGFGGFGCDHEDRGPLLGIGAARGAARLGVPLAACRIVVIGDTPRDVEAARFIGAISIAVATGPFTREELASSGADHVVADLLDPAMLEAILGSAA